MKATYNTKGLFIRYCRQYITENSHFTRGDVVHTENKLETLEHVHHSKQVKTP